MFDGIIDVAIKQDLTEDLRKSLEELKNKMVCVGIPEEENVVHSTENHEKITNAQLLYIHTHGIRDKEMIQEMQHNMSKGTPYSKAYEFYVHEHGSPLFRVPPRPVLAPAIENSKEMIAEQMKLTFQAVLDGSNSSVELNKIGMLGQNIARAWFTSPENKWATNSPLTVKKKGSDRPLIDTGALRKSLTWILRNKGE